MEDKDLRITINGSGEGGSDHKQVYNRNSEKAEDGSKENGGPITRYGLCLVNRLNESRSPYVSSSYRNPSKRANIRNI